MAVNVHNFVTAAIGLQDLRSVTGTVTIYTDTSSSLNDDSSEYYSVYDPANNNFVVAATTTNGGTPSGGHVLGFQYITSNSFDVVISDTTGTILTVSKSGSTITLTDANDSAISGISGTSGTGVHFLAVYFEHSASGAVELFIDGISAGSSTGEDLTSGGTLDAVTFTAGTTLSTSAGYFRSIYIASGLTDSSEVPAKAQAYEFTFEAYNTRTSDEGDTLDTALGFWHYCLEDVNAPTNYEYNDTYTAGFTDTAAGAGRMFATGAIVALNNLTPNVYIDSGNAVDSDNVWTDDVLAANGDISDHAYTTTQGTLGGANGLKVYGVTAYNELYQGIKSVQCRLSIYVSASCTVGYRVQTSGGAETLYSNTQLETSSGYKYKLIDLSEPTGGWSQSVIENLEVTIWRTTSGTVELQLRAVEFLVQHGSGPANNTIFTSGTMLASKGHWRIARSGGGGTDHFGQIGKWSSGSSTYETTADFDPSTAFSNYEYMASSGYIPSSSEYGVLGISKGAGGQDYICSGATYTLLYSPPFSAGNPDLEAISGSYTLSGQSADLDKTEVMPANAGSYTYTGQSADLDKTEVMPANAGSYAYTGSDATLTYAAETHLNAETGSYTYTGQTVDLLRSEVLTVDAGSYTYSGINNDFISGYALTVNAGSYTYTGVNNAFSAGSVLQTNAGSYTYAGQTVDLLRSEVLTVDAGSYTYTGVDNDFISGYVLTVNAGSYTYTGVNNVFSAGSVLQANAGSYTYTGQIVDLDLTNALQTNTGSYTYTGSSASLQTALTFQVDAGSYTYTGINLAFASVGSLPANTGSYIQSVQNPSLIKDSLIELASGTYTYTGKTANLQEKIILQTDAGSYTQTGQPVTFIKDSEVKPTSGNYTYGGKSAEFFVGTSVGFDAGSYTYTGSSATLTPVYFMKVDTGEFNQVGRSIKILGADSAPPVGSCRTFNFKKEAQVYIVYSNSSYRIDISEINFNQTFKESTYSSKSIHTQNLFDQSVINSANPANFEFTFPAIREDDFKVVFDRALDCEPFTLYVKTTANTFKITNCVITNAKFIVEKLRPLSMTISGEGSRLFVYSFLADIDGTEVPRAGTMTYNKVSDLEITLAGVDTLSTYTSEVSLELQNNVSWIPYTHIHGALDVRNAAADKKVDTTMYPNNFVIKNKVLAGTVTQYIDENNTNNLLQWSTNSTLHIQAGQEVSGTLYGFDLNLTNCSFTNRVTSGDVFTQSYDWRLTQNPTNLSDIITYTTLP